MKRGSRTMNPDPTPIIHDVVVVGGGVVGAAAALALSRQRFNVALVERGGRPPGFDPGTVDPRVYAIAPGTAHILDGLGVWDAVVANRVSPYRRMQVWESQPDRGLDFDAAGTGADVLGYIVEDRLLRTALWDALGAVATQLQCAAVSLHREDGVSLLELDNGVVLEAPLVIAAEGADSALREWAGIDTTGWDYPQRSIVSHVSTELPHENTAYQRFLARGPLAFLPLSDGRSSIVWSTDLAEAKELMAMDDAEFSERLEQAFGHRLGLITAVSPRLSFPLRLVHAESYVRPGVALVGDSAHVVHPLAGQGVNLGLADVAALVEILVDAREHKRDWNLRLLKRYERRRKAENVEMLALTDGLFRLFRQRSPAVAALREAGMFLVNRLGPVKGPLTRRAMGL